MNKLTLNRLLSLVGSEKKYLCWGLLFLILSSGTGLLFPQIIRFLIDNVLTPRRMDLLVPGVLGIFIIFILQGISASLRYYFFTLSGEKIVLQLRQKLFGRILHAEVAFFDFNRTGDLMSRLSSDCTTLQNTVSVNISMALRNLAQVLGGFCFMFYTSWKLSLLMLIFIPPLGISTLIFGKRIRKIAHDFQDHLAGAGIIAEETISGIRTVKSFVQEEEETHRYQQWLGRSLLVARKKIATIAVFMTWAMVAGFAAISFVLWYGGGQVVENHLSMGDLTQFLLYLMIVAIGAGALGNLWGDFMSGIGASKRVFEMMESLPPESLSSSDPKSTGFPSALTPLTLKNQFEVEFREVRFRYPSRPDVEVLKGINLKILPGKMVAVVGPSGSGKTTLTSLLSKFYEITEGEILLDGKNIKELPSFWLREQIGIVSQEPLLISATIEENIRYGRKKASDEEVIEAAKVSNALEFIQRLPEGLKTRVGEKGHHLSGGQRQRVAIARAILKNPKVLILDEATSNLDMANESIVQEALQRLMRGRTTLIITHRLTMAKNADFIYVMDEGRMTQQGHYKELSQDSAGIFYQLLHKQFTSKIPIQGETINEKDS